MSRGPRVVRAAVDRVKRAGWRGLGRVADRLNFDLVYRDWYSPIPDVRSLPVAIWSVPKALPGIDFDLERQFQLLEQELAPGLDDFDPHREPPASGTGFFLENPTYASVDAEILYAFIRRYRPKRVLELGSGFSSLLVEEAADRNRSEGAQLEHRVLDPSPWLEALQRGDGPISVERIAGADVPLDEFERLGDGDLLFVDTTHTVKLGGDVNHIVLYGLSRLAPGVIVQFHDVFLPWEYPRSWLEDRQWYWAEQYLLQAYLSFNPGFEVLVGAYALARSDPARLRRTIPSYDGRSTPSAFWLRRTGAS